MSMLCHLLETRTQTYQTVTAGTEEGFRYGDNPELRRFQNRDMDN